ERNNDGALQDAALNAYKAAAELDPLMFSPQLGQGRLCVKRREHKKATENLTTANQIRPDDAETAYLLGIAYQEIGGEKKNKVLAIKWLEFAMQKKSIGEAAYRLGQLNSDPEINNAAAAQNGYAKAVRLGVADEKAGQKVAWLSDAMHELGSI